MTSFRHRISVLFVLLGSPVACQKHASQSSEVHQDAAEPTPIERAKAMLTLAEAAQLGVNGNIKQMELMMQDRDGVRRYLTENERNQVAKVQGMMAAQKTGAEADGIAIDNASKALDIEIKKLYGYAYGRYVNTLNYIYKNVQQSAKMRALYKQSLTDSWKKVQKFTDATNRCLGLMRNYWSLKRKQGSERLAAYHLSWTNLGEVIADRASHRMGATCMNRVLLIDFGNRDLAGQLMRRPELESLQFKQIPDDDGNTVKVICPSDLDRPINYPTSLDSAVDFYNYPMVVEDDGNTGDVAGIFHPTTYYQVFRALTDFDGQLKLGKPSVAKAKSAAVCRTRLNPNRQYEAKSMEAEGLLSQAYASYWQDSNGELGSYTPQVHYSVKKANPDYNDFLENWARILNSVDKCILAMSAAAPEPRTSAEPEGENAAVSAGLLQQEGEMRDPDTEAAAALAGVSLKTFNDPNDPIFSEGARACFQEAEGYLTGIPEVLGNINRLTEALLNLQDPTVEAPMPVWQDKAVYPAAKLP